MLLGDVGAVLALSASERRYSTKRFEKDCGGQKM